MIKIYNHLNKETEVCVIKKLNWQISRSKPA